MRKGSIFLPLGSLLCGGCHQLSHDKFEGAYGHMRDRGEAPKPNI